MPATKREMIAQLQKELLLLQGFKPATASTQPIGLGPVETAFPNAIFPTGAIHEFISDAASGAAATGGFIAGLLSSLMQTGSTCIWISASRTLFPPALQAFGVAPHQVLFIDLSREKDVLWAMEEALHCEGLAAVVGEIKELDLTASRRLQLAAEQGRVTGFVLRHQSRRSSTIASVARWRITPLPSKPGNELPGVGFPRWQVELLKVRNGRPGQWPMEWAAGAFQTITPATGVPAPLPIRKIG